MSDKNKNRDQDKYTKPLGINHVNNIPIIPDDINKILEADLKKQAESIDSMMQEAIQGNLMTSAPSVANPFTTKMLKHTIQKFKDQRDYIFLDSRKRLEEAAIAFNKRQISLCNFKNHFDIEKGKVNVRAYNIYMDHIKKYGWTSSDLIDFDNDHRKPKNMTLFSILVSEELNIPLSVIHNYKNKQGWVIWLNDETFLNTRNS